MIITLKGADFSASNIGTLSSWRISRSLGAGATYAGATSVDKGAAFSATVTLAEVTEKLTETTSLTVGAQVKDKTGSVLPSTGGKGAIMLISIGTMVAMGFAVLLITQKKMSVYRD